TADRARLVGSSLSFDPHPVLAGRADHARGGGGRGMDRQQRRLTARDRSGMEHAATRYSGLAGGLAQLPNRGTSPTIAYRDERGHRDREPRPRILSRLRIDRERA